MFNWRKSQKKPSTELFKSFKENHPEVGGQTQRLNSSSALPCSASHSQAAAESSTLTGATDGLPANAASRPAGLQTHDHKDANPTLRGSDEPWSFGSSGLTPALMDVQSHPSFHMFDHLAGGGYYPPTPGGGNHALFHSQPGHHHTSGFDGMGISTPLSLPTSEAALHPGQQPAYHHHGFPTQLSQHISQQQFNSVNPFQLQPQSFAPHQFTHQSSFDADGPLNESPIDDLGMDLGSSTAAHSPEMLFRPQTLPDNMAPGWSQSRSEKFRYHVTLNAPTAMIANAGDVPVTYLNKGQAYTLNVVDTQGQPAQMGRRYRTFVRVSFEDEQQRQKPGQCWQLWKEGRGTNEAHHRGGRLQAVEYVDTSQIGSHHDSSKPKFELESSSFDGFCVLWTPSAGSVDCPIQVRFNFLSTDFSHSKGVKGIPVRLCAKTQLLDADSGDWAQSAGAEVSYCMVKLFRDHGAERKLSNDVAHVKKTIDKLNQQMAQIEAGMRDFGKRKRSGSLAKNTLDTRPGKVPKHRRTWSMNSVTSNGGRGSAEEDLHRKLVALNDRFSSTRPVSVLHLRGEDSDDPDLSPVTLSGDTGAFVKPSLSVQETTDSACSWDRPHSELEPNSAIVSPTPSHNSLVGSRKDSSMQQPTPLGTMSKENSDEWQKTPNSASTDLKPPALEKFPSSAGSPTKVSTRSPRGGTITGSIEVRGVDSAYEPPRERPSKPMACFYVLPRVDGASAHDEYHRAIYLTKRTLENFTDALATKCGIDPALVIRIVRTPRGSDMQILIDDDCIREMPEGQDMTAVFRQVQSDSATLQKRQWDAGPTDGDSPSLEDVSAVGYQLNLTF